MRSNDRFWRLAGRASAWLAVLAVGFFLRTWQLRDQLLADDEWHAVRKLLGSDFSGIFTSFGFTDHSIALTLYYKALSLTTGLSEWAMHLPLLGAGLLTLVLVPWLMRDVLRPPERLTLAGLLALSPILVYFSRTARPYALSALLAFVALAAFYRCWNRPGYHWGGVYVVSTALAAWLHPVTLSLTLTPFVLYGAVAVRDAASLGEFRSLKRICVIGVATLAALSLLLAAPLYFDHAMLQARSGVHAVSLASLWASLSLFAGAANMYVVTAWLLCAVAGFRELLDRRASLAWYFVLAVLLAGLVTVAASPLLIKHPLVLARYLLPTLFILLLLAALGAHRLLRALREPLRFPLIAAALVGLYLSGPLPELYGPALNQFTGHMSYQADYDKARNRYARHFQLDARESPAFYRELADLPPGSVTLAVAPWYLEWHWNAWHLNQQIHRQRIMAGFVSGLCVEKTYGEFPPGAPGMEFANVIHLVDLAGRPDSPADFLVFEKDMPFQPPPSARPGLDWPACEQELRKLFGPPWVEDDAMLVWKLRNAGIPVPAPGPTARR